MSNAESGFKATGIYPFADGLFNETDFAPSTVTDQLQSNQTDEVHRNLSCIDEIADSDETTTPCVDNRNKNKDNNELPMETISVIRKKNWQDEENTASTVAATVNHFHE